MFYLKLHIQKSWRDVFCGQISEERVWKSHDLFTDVGTVVPKDLLQKKLMSNRKKGEMNRARECSSIQQAPMPVIYNQILNTLIAREGILPPVRLDAFKKVDIAI